MLQTCKLCRDRIRKIQSPHIATDPVQSNSNRRRPALQSIDGNARKRQRTNQVEIRVDPHSTARVIEIMESKHNRRVGGDSDDEIDSDDDDSDGDDEPEPPSPDDDSNNGNNERNRTLAVEPQYIHVANRDVVAIQLCLSEVVISHPGLHGTIDIQYQPIQSLNEIFQRRSKDTTLTMLQTHIRAV
ncbi:MAG: hypothetical protein MMC33_010824 [Icmadophila ericetorum]|nr:hypothetical protein [Icmadophila ericetorum]